MLLKGGSPIKLFKLISIGGISDSHFKFPLDDQFAEKSTISLFPKSFA